MSPGYNKHSNLKIFPFTLSLPLSPSPCHLSPRVVNINLDQSYQVETSMKTAPKDTESIFKARRPKRGVECPIKIIANLLASTLK